MSKKHWIYIKRGLSEDAKHRDAMGECVWLYMHIIDRADWETGIAFDWIDREEAADMGMPLDTLRRQRQKLEEGGYIRTEQKQHSQNVYIMEWRNPREYDGAVRNPRSESPHEWRPSTSEGDRQGLNEGLNQGASPGAALLLDSKSKTKTIEDDDGVTKREVILEALHQENFGRVTPLMQEILHNAAIDFPEVSWYAPAFKSAVEHNARSWRYVDKILLDWKDNGRPGNGKKAAPQIGTPERQRAIEAKIARFVE